MNSPFYGWVVPTSAQEDLIYGSEAEDLTYQELQDLEADRYDDRGDF